MNTAPPARWPVAFTASLAALAAAWVVLGLFIEGQISGIALFLTAVWVFFLFRAMEIYRRECREFFDHEVTSSTEGTRGL
jgi:hypothetical protein